MAEKDLLLAKLLATATAGAKPTGRESKRQPIRIVLHPACHQGGCAGRPTCSTCGLRLASPPTTMLAP